MLLISQGLISKANWGWGAILLRQKIGNWNVAGLYRWCVSALHVSVQWHSVDGNVTVYIWALVGVITVVLGPKPSLPS